MNLFKLSLASTILAFVLAGCAGQIGTSPQGMELPIEKAALKLGSDINAGGYKVVTTDELKKWLDDKQPVLVVSSLPVEDDKAFGIIPGAVNAPMPKTEKDLTPIDAERLLKVAGNNKERTVVVYCGFVACRRSHIAAKLLVDNGYMNVYRYPGGIAGWSEAGYPLLK
jgi:rhodanese-related sulfurtransferase